MAGIVIVGAGHGGVQLAASLREAGYAGTVSLVSADPDMPYHKPPLSKSFMKDHDTPLQALRGDTFFEDRQIDLLLGVEVARIERANKRITCTDGRAIGYDKLILATGTVARKLGVPGADLAGVHTLRTAADARALRAELNSVRAVAIIGGGFIGLEAAAMLRARGCEVCVIEAAPRLLGRAVSATTAQAIGNRLHAAGIALRLDAKVHALDGEGGRIRAVTLQEGSHAPETLAADLVIIGIGAQPLDGLAREAGLSVENGIRVDEFLATQDPDIFALGDCASFPLARTGQVARLESVQNASDQARALALTLTGKPTRYDALAWFWSDIGDLKLQIAGLADRADKSLEHFHPDGQLRSVYHMRAEKLLAVETLNSAGEHMLARRLIAENIALPLELLQKGDLAALKAAYQAGGAS